MINSTQITVPYFFLLLLLLAVCVDFGCRAQRRTYIYSFSEFQTTNSELILRCDTDNSKSANEQITFNYNGVEVYNSKTKVENGIRAVVEDQANRPSTLVRVLDRKSYLSNVTCSYNNLVSFRSLNIPYINIDQYSHSQDKFELNQTVTISCTIAMVPLPPDFTIFFLFNGEIYSIYLATNKNADPLFVKLGYPDAEITPVLESRFPKYSIKVKPFRNIDNFRHGKGRCELYYNNLKIQSDELDFSKNLSATLSPTISALTLVCICVVSYLLNPVVL